MKASIGDVYVTPIAHAQPCERFGMALTKVDDSYGYAPAEGGARRTTAADVDWATMGNSHTKVRTASRSARRSGLR